jgi:ABC-type molybdate transport system substrate-binding protein
MSKAEIVQKLLDQDKITAEEAVVLLKQDMVITNPSPGQTYPGTPYEPVDSDWTWDPNRWPITYTDNTNTHTTS